MKAARGWRVSQGNAMRCRCAAAAIAAINSVRNRLPGGRLMNGGGRGTARPRAAERRCRAARRHVGLQARNALIGRMGLLRLLAQNHAVIRTAERTRRALEAERGALRVRELGRDQQHRCNQASCADMGLHGTNLSAPNAAATKDCADRSPGQWGFSCANGSVAQSDGPIGFDMRYCIRPGCDSRAGAAERIATMTDPESATGKAAGTPIGEDLRAVEIKHWQ